MRNSGFTDFSANTLRAAYDVSQQRSVSGGSISVRRRNVALFVYSAGIPRLPITGRPPAFRCTTLPNLMRLRPDSQHKRGDHPSSDLLAESLQVEETYYRCCRSTLKRRLWETDDAVT